MGKKGARHGMAFFAPLVAHESVWYFGECSLAPVAVGARGVRAAWTKALVARRICGALWPRRHIGRWRSCERWSSSHRRNPQRFVPTLRHDIQYMHAVSVPD